MIKVIDAPTSRAELKEIAKTMFGNMVKAVADVDKGVMAVGGELHSDEEGLLIEQGSRQEHLWGINLYPDLDGDDFIEFDSMINLRPSHNNLSRSVDDQGTRDRITAVVTRLVK